MGGKQLNLAVGIVTFDNFQKRKDSENQAAEA